VKAALAFIFCLVTVAITSAALAQPQDGEISGVVLSAAGRPLAGQQIALRRPSREGPGHLLTVTREDGAFSYPRLGTGRYQVEWHIQGRAVAKSAEIELSDSMMHASNVILALPQAKRFIDELRVGDKPRVNVQMRDGTKAAGDVREIGEESFTVTDANRFRTVTIAYDDVLTIRRGRSEWAKLLIFVGTSMGVLMGAMAIALIAAGGP
jgi:hypothetical protein